MKSKISILTIFLLQDSNKKSLNQSSTSQKVWSEKISSNLILVTTQSILSVPKPSLTIWSKLKVSKFFWFIIVVLEHSEPERLPKVSRVLLISRPFQSEETECKMQESKQLQKVFNMFHYLKNCSFIKTLWENKDFNHCLSSYLNIAKIWHHLICVTTLSDRRPLKKWQKSLKTVKS